MWKTKHVKYTPSYRICSVHVAYASSVKLRKLVKLNIKLQCFIYVHDSKIADCWVLPPGESRWGINTFSHAVLYLFVISVTYCSHSNVEFCAVWLKMYVRDPSSIFEWFWKFGDNLKQHCISCCYWNLFLCWWMQIKNVDEVVWVLRCSVTK